MLLKCLTQYVRKFEKFSNGYRTGKCQFSFQSQRRAMPRKVQTTILLLISYVSQVMLKTLQAMLQQYVTWELPKYKLDLEKTEEPEIKLSTFIGSWRKQASSRKNIYFYSTDYVKVFDCVDHNKLESSSRDGNTRPPYLSPEKPICGSIINS